MMTISKVKATCELILPSNGANKILVISANRSMLNRQLEIKSVTLNYLNERDDYCGVAIEWVQYIGFAGNQVRICAKIFP